MVNKSPGSQRNARHRWPSVLSVVFIHQEHLLNNRWLSILHLGFAIWTSSSWLPLASGRRDTLTAMRSAHSRLTRLVFAAPAP
jgi:hypothetical protein